MPQLTCGEGKTPTRSSMALRILFLRVSKPVFAKTRTRSPLRNFLAFLAKMQAEEVLVKALADQNEQLWYEHGLFRELGKPKQILHVRILLDSLDGLLIAQILHMLHYSTYQPDLISLLRHYLSRLRLPHR